MKQNPFKFTLNFCKKPNFKSHVYQEKLNKDNKQLKIKIFKSLSSALSIINLFSFYHFPIYSTPPQKCSVETKRKNSFPQFLSFNLQAEIDYQNAMKNRPNLKKQACLYKQSERREKGKFIAERSILQNKINNYLTDSMSSLIQNLYSLELNNSVRESCIKYSYQKYLQIQKKLQNLFDKYKLEDFIPMSHSMKYGDDKSIEISPEKIVSIHEINGLSFSSPIQYLPKNLILPIGKNVFVNVKAKYNTTRPHIEGFYFLSDSEKKMWKNFCPECNNLSSEQLNAYISKKYENIALQ